MRSKWHILATACRIILGLVFLTAGILKALHPAGFAFQIEAYEIIPGSISNLAAIFFILTEIVLGVALIINYHPRVVLPSAAFLILIFMSANLWAWSQGKIAGCGCFGSLADRTPAEVVVEDTIFLGLLIIGWFGNRGMKSEVTFWRKGVFFASGLLAGLLLISGSKLPVDNLVTRLKVGADLSDLFVEDIDVNLYEGEYLVVLLGEKCSGCIQIVEDLNALSENDQVPEIVGAFVGDREKQVAFWWQTGATFSLGNVPYERVAPLYRNLPRTFLLKDGVVQKVWNDRAPTLDEFLTIARHSS